MYKIWNYLYPETPIKDNVPNIKFGKWSCQLDYLDYYYHRLATRLIQFAKEVGKDPYDRYFDFEPFVDFVIEKGITDKSADYMYRHYVYYIVSQHEPINIDQEEVKYIFDNFSV